MPTVKRVKTVPASDASRPMWAVLPIRAITPDAGSACLAEGLSEELVHQLSQGFDKRIVSFTSTRANAAELADARKVGSSYGVSHLLEGSIRVEGKVVRASIRLVDTVMAAVSWSAQFDRLLDSTFSLQEELALTICNALRLQATCKA